MGKKTVVFDLPYWAVLILNAGKRVFAYLTIAGVGGIVVESQYQFKPLATLVFIVLRELCSSILSTYINQEITDEDK